MKQGEPIAMDRKEGLDLFDGLITTLLILLVLLSPLPFGSVAPWARNAVFVVALLLGGLWLFQSALRGRLLLCKSPLWIAVPVVAILVVFQLIPMNPGLLETLSPESAGFYRETLPGWAAGGEGRTLSLAPRATIDALLHFGALVLILFAVMNTIRTRGQVTALILALAAVGTFEVLYGFAEQFSGHPQIFWNERIYHLPAVTGTFHNKNHFAGLLEIIVPMVLGLFIALSPRAVRSPSVKTRLVHLFSAAGTHRQIILGACLVLMTVGIFFSLSRAGILCAVGSWAGFALVVSMTSGFRKYTLALLLIVLITLSVAMCMGTGMVIDGIEDAASGKATSWADRTDLWHASLGIIAAYPVFGTGLGTFANVFEGYQSMRFGDRYADYLHNDWLQIFCELGLFGGLLVTSSLLFLLFSLFRRTLARRDPFCRWVALGAMMGICAILLHSFFDYNLYKITSNGVLFAVILGLWHAAVSLPHRGEPIERRYFSVPLRSVSLRTVLAVSLLGLLCLPAYFAIRTGAADIHFNRFLAGPEIRGRVEDYHFLKPPAGPTEGSENHLEAARALDPANPRYAFFAGLDELKGAEKNIRRQAEQSARTLLGPDIESCDPAGFKQVVDAIAQSLRPRMAEQYRPSLMKAAKWFRSAIALSPGTALYHLNLASLNARLGDVRAALTEAGIALRLAPAKPSVLFETGKIFTEGGFTSGVPADRATAFDFAVHCFRRALRADPEYADRIYAVARTAMGGQESLRLVTPLTLAGYEKLTRELWSAGQWRDVLSCLDTSREIVEGDPPRRAVSPPDGDAKDRALEAFEGEIRLRLEGRGNRPDNAEEVLCAISKQRCTVLSILGDWPGRAAEAARFNLLLREMAAGKIRKAQKLRQNGQYDKSFRLYLEVLEEDWKNQAALLTAAELAGLPRDAEKTPLLNRPIDLLFRLIVNNEPLEEGVLDKALEILDALRLEQAEDLLNEELIRGAGRILAGRFDDGIERLIRLTPRAEEIGAFWRQRHLVWFYLGQGYEKRREWVEAAKAYARVVREVPTHYPALKRLAVLQEQDIPIDKIAAAAGCQIPCKARLEAITPEIPCRAAFGGKVVLLGLTLEREEAAEETEGGAWSLTYYWMFKVPMAEGYNPMVHFCDENWRTLFQDDHRPRFMNRPYPVDLPRSGEVVVEKRRLGDDPARARYLRIGITTAAPLRYGPKHLISDAGDCFFLTSSDAMM